MPKFHENFLLGRLKLRQLRLLTAIADEGTVLKGSQALNIAQPAATKSIKELEDALGVQLFERSSRGVTPTDFGAVMIKHGKLILAQLRHAGEELQSLEEGLSGRVHVGTLLAASTSLLPRALARLRERRPGIAVTVAEGTIDRLMPGLRTGDIDVVLGRLPEYREREGLKQDVLYLDTVSIMVRAGHPLTQRDALTLADLVDQAWVMPPTQTSLRRQIDQAFRHEDLDPPLDVIESVSILTNHALLMSTDMGGGDAASGGHRSGGPRRAARNARRRQFADRRDDACQCRTVGGRRLFHGRRPRGRRRDSQRTGAGSAGFRRGRHAPPDEIGSSDQH